MVTMTDASNSKPKYWAIVPAAGVGKRMSTAVPKQYLKLDDTAVIDITLGRLLNHPSVSGVVVAISEEDELWTQTLYAGHENVTVVPGGDERCHSVLNALQILQTIAAENDRVLVHDAARPCITHQDISTLIDRAGLSEQGGLLGIPVKDTMKWTDDESGVVKTLDRNHLWHAFTPQLFPIKTLLSALQNALSHGGLVTDDASAMELAGFKPLMVEGRQDNVKITRPEDLSLAAFYLKQQSIS